MNYRLSIILFGIVTLLSTQDLLALRPLDPTEQVDLIAGGLPIEKNLFNLDKELPKKADLPGRFWKNHGWRMLRGGVSERFDWKYRNLSTWEERHNYVQKWTLRDILAVKDEDDRQDWIDKLSPTEKYDLAMGNLDTPLTTYYWNKMKEVNDAKEMFVWRGFCDDEAGSVVYFPEPQYEVVIHSRIPGVKIKFYLRDIKGLAALNMSQVGIDVPQSGTRCKEDDPKQGKSSEYLDYAAFDVNPAALHIALVNFIGKHNLPVLVDRDQERPVWNTPIKRYSFRYKNPKSGKRFDKLADALVEAAEFPQDKFKAYRSANAHYIVGVEMEAGYSTVYSESLGRDERERADEHMTTLTYDLEIDLDGTIVGGEWHQEYHPDFLYVFLPGTEPFSEGEKLGGLDKECYNLWKRDQPIPDTWAQASEISSPKGQPLYLVVRKLVEWSLKK
jgi:hypothetical protein